MSGVRDIGSLAEAAGANRWGRRGAGSRDSGQQRRDAQDFEILIGETALSGIARHVLLVCLSLLPVELRQPQHLRLARAAVKPLALADRARMFQLPNDDIALVWRGDAEAALHDSLQALGHLFEDEADPQDAASGLTRMFSLPGDAALLRGVIADTTGEVPAGPGQPRGIALDGATLTALEAALARADLSRFARRRAVCARTPDGFELRWEQRALSIPELAETLTPGHDLRADPWLYLRLTRTLDSRLLNLLACPEELRGAQAFSLALNVRSVLSPDFLRFDAALPAALRGQVTLDLLAADLMADPAAFRFARDFARARRYRLMLRGIGAGLMGTFPRELAGVDLVQLDWTPELARTTSEQPAQTVLSGADTQAALDWGTAQGIGFYQGRMVRPTPVRAATPRPDGTDRWRLPLARRRLGLNRAG